MRKKKPKYKKAYHRLVFGLGVLVLGSIVGIAFQFALAWVEPSTSAPNGNIAAPINMGATTQTKKGGDICVDTNGDGVNEGCVGSGGSGANLKQAPLGCGGYMTTSDTCYSLAYGTQNYCRGFGIGQGEGQNLCWWSYTIFLDCDGSQNGRGSAQICPVSMTRENQTIA
jgi:hypothetical protein